MVYLQNNIVSAFSLNRLLYELGIFRFYEKAQVPLFTNYL
jgi:hypothetical protein